MSKHLLVRRNEVGFRVSYVFLVESLVLEVLVSCHLGIRSYGKL